MRRRPFPNGTPAIVRFAHRVAIDPQSGCWQWGGPTTRGFWAGRGEGGNITAYEYAYRRFVGDYPVGLELDHLCCNPHCVNPDHLEPVTQTENLRRQTHRARAWATQELRERDAARLRPAA